MRDLHAPLLAASGPLRRAAPGRGTRIDSPQADAEHGEIAYYVESATDGKTPPDAIHPEAHYRTDKLRYQDFMVLETQGAIANRPRERLGTSDRGVALLRSVLKREIEKVQRGIDPIGVVREGDNDLIDTYFHGFQEKQRV